MAPHVGRAGLTMGVFLIVLSLIILPFLEPNSPQFVVTLIAITITSFWLGFIIWSIRRETAVPKVKPDRNRPAGANEKADRTKKQPVQDKEGVVK